MPWSNGVGSAKAGGASGAAAQDGSALSDDTNNQVQDQKQPKRSSSAPSEPTRSRFYGPSLAVKPGVANGYAPQGTGGSTAPLYGSASASGAAPSYGTAPLRTDAGSSAPLVTRGDAVNDAPAVVTPRDSKPQIIQASPATTRGGPSASPPSGSSVASSLAQDLQSGDTTPRDSRSLQERLAAIRRSSESAQPTPATPDVAAGSPSTDAPLAAAPATTSPPTTSPAISPAPTATAVQTVPSKPSPPPGPSPFEKSSPLASTPAASTPAVVEKTSPPAAPSPISPRAAVKPPIVSAPAAAPAPLAAAASPKFGPSSRRTIPSSEKDDELVAPPHKEALAHEDPPRTNSPSKTASVAPPARIDSPFEATVEQPSPLKSERVESSPVARSATNPFAPRDASGAETRTFDSKNLVGKALDDKPVDDKSLDNLDNKPLPSWDGSNSESKAVATKVPDAKSRDSKSAAVASVSTTKQSPVVSVETTGPRTIVIGKEATYLVTIKNSGDAGAQDLTVTVKIPEWTDVAGAQASAGATRPATDNNEPLQWKIPRLEAHGKETLSLRLLPRKGRGFDLAVQWSFTPIASQTQVEVQEPKLNMTIAGPDEVIFGQSKLYRLTISNPGTGDAENVVVQLDPIGSSQAPPSKHPIGTIHAGDSKVVELELTARQTGTIAIHAAASAEPGLKAEAGEDVLVRRAAVALGVEGPRSKYAGTLAAYSIHVSNPGNATAENVRITATLPQGAKFISASAGGQWKADQSKVIWSLPALRSSGETSLELKCALAAPGPNRLQVNSAAAGDVSDVANITTNVEALADLKLEVTEPAGPIAVGDEVSYEVHIRNRGSKAADAVAVVIYFSEGLEPVAAQGNPYDISNGVVAFRPLASVAANGEAVLKIKAKADRSGKQVFRAEVECGALGTKLASSQEMVVYGGDDAPGLDRADRGIAGRNSQFQSAPNRLDDAAPKPLRR